jgi:hypothetical protein
MENNTQMNEEMEEISNGLQEKIRNLRLVVKVIQSVGPSTFVVRSYEMEHIID